MALCTLNILMMGAEYLYGFIRALKKFASTQVVFASELFEHATSRMRTLQF